ncbi:caspase-1-A-like [Hyperolius riggenbachi]|uniref:caspase-1-A-like n=1 Tax=Hyperolius riggenbachi TaxID=752182 RepID=UPI0035A2727C
MADKLFGLRKGLIEGGNIALLRALLDDLQEDEILSHAEAEYIDERNLLSRDKLRALVDIVWKKGDRSSNILIQRVSERDKTLSEELGITVCTLPSVPSQEQHVSTSTEPAPSELLLPTQEQKVEPTIETGPYGIKLCSTELYEKICSEECGKLYEVCPQETRKRRALVICNKKFDHPDLGERRGAEFDVDGMQKLLEGLGYEVEQKTNLTVEEMRDTMKTFAAHEDHKASDSTFLVFMSHGMRDVICGTDMKLNETERKEINVLKTDEIFTTFNNENCPALRDKPKIILIQACRGCEHSRVLVNDGPCAPQNDDKENLEDDRMRWMHKECDFICFCSTTPDTVSKRDPDKGSLFILSLIKNIKENAHRWPIEDIFKEVQRSFENRAQMPTVERNTLLKKFYLFPGH